MGFQQEYKEEYEHESAQMTATLTYWDRSKTQATSLSLASLL